MSRLKKISPFYLGVLLIFYVAWGNFWHYQSFFNHDESLMVPFKMFDELEKFSPFYLKVWDNFREWMTYKEFLKPMIYFSPLIAGLLFFHFFERAKKIPWASIIFILGPFLFYNLSLNDYRLSLMMIYAVLYLVVYEKSQKWRARNLLLIIMLIVGTFLDYSFLLLAMIDIFSDDKKSERIARGAGALILLGIILYFQQRSLEIIKPKIELLYDQKYFNAPQVLLFYFNAVLEFIGATKSLGVAFVERKVVLHDWGMKLVLLCSLSGFLVRFYRRYFLRAALLICLTALVAFLLTSSSMTIVFAGNYLSTMAFKGTMLFPAFLIMCYGMSKLEVAEFRLNYFVLAVVLLSWMNLINNVQNNISNIHRDESPVFWGIIQNTHLKFASSFTQAYKEDVKKLHPDDRLFVDGLKNINPNVYLEYQQRRNSPATLLDSFVYSQQGQFLKALENLGVLQQNGVISNRAFLEYAGKINAGFEAKLESTIHPLIYELLYKADGFSLAEKVYLLALFQYTNMGNDEVVRMLIHEFGAVFQTKK